MADAGENIRQLAERRKSKAIQRFFFAGILFIIPIVLYSISSITGISIFIYIGCLVGAAFLAYKGQKLWSASQRAEQGAKAEKTTALVLSELEREGWEVEYNIPLKGWGDGDAFLRSPKGNYFVIDTKSDGGTIFFDGTNLMKRYGKDIYPFSNNKDVLKAARGQALSLKKMKDVHFVTPVICFSRADLDIKAINNKVENVYILNYDSLVRILKKVDK